MEFLIALANFWQRSSILLWALAAAALFAFAGTEVVVWIDPTVAETAKTVRLGLFTGGIGLLVLAAFKTFQERTVRTLRLVPNEAQSFCHVAIQPDGAVLTQLALHYETFNLTDRTIWISEVKLSRPAHSRILHKMATIQDQQSEYHGRYSLPPQARSDGTAHFMVEGDLAARVKRSGVTARIADQFGNWHKLRLPDIRVI